MGPGYSSSGHILESSQHLASHLRRSARIGYRYSKRSERCESHFFGLLKNAGLKINWPSWGSDDFWCLTWVPTDQGEEDGAGISRNVTHFFSSWFTGAPTDLLDVYIYLKINSFFSLDFVALLTSANAPTPTHLVSMLWKEQEKWVCVSLE